MRQKILYLEDDDFTRLMVRKQLEIAGYYVESVKSYSNAVIALTENNFDFIISDLHLEGLEPRRLITGLKSLSSIPIIILSATDQEYGDINIKKPLTAKKIQKIRKMLNQQSSEPRDLDFSKVYQFACGDSALFAEYLDIFLANINKDLTMLKKEIERRANNNISSLAHKMLSSVSYYNSQPLNTSLRSLEKDAKHLNTEKLWKLYNVVKKYADDLSLKICLKLQEENFKQNNE